MNIIFLFAFGLEYFTFFFLTEKKFKQPARQAKSAEFPNLRICFRE